MVFFVIFFAQLGASVIQAIGIPSLGTWYDWNCYIHYEFNLFEFIF